MSRKTGVFVLGSLDYAAARKGEALTDATLELLDDITEKAGVDAEIVFAVQDPKHAGKGKAKIKMAAIKEERPRVINEIENAKPDFVMCFGPVATASVFGKGNLVEGELLRKAHHPLAKVLHDEMDLVEDYGPPVYVTFGMENVRWKAGLRKWLVLDVSAAAHGWTDTEWGDYQVFLPGTPEWDRGPFMRTMGGLEYRNLELEVVGYDLETYPGLSPWDKDARIRMAVISDQVGRAWVVQATQDSRFPQWVYDLVEDPNITKAGSNIKFDYRWHRRFGHRIVNMYDTSTHEHIIDESNPKKDLKSLTFRYVPKLGDYSREQRDLVRQRGGWEHIQDEEMYQYAGGDGEASIGAYLGQQALLEGKSQATRLFKDLYQTLAEMEHNGACISMNTNRELDKLYQAKLARLREEIVDVLGPINLNSPMQLAKALKAHVPNVNLALREWKRIVGDDEDEETSTKRDVLEREAHKHPIIAKVLEFRSYRTRHSTFIKSVHEKYAQHHSGAYFVHPTFRTDVVETYRLSSQQPNGQNVPRKDNDDAELTVKKQFVSRFKGGEILEADQSQIEIRFAAWLSQDANMIAAIESGEDIHTAMAAIMLDKPVAEVTEIERQECKTRTFLILYGGGANKLARDLKISRRRAQRMIDEYFETFSGLANFIHETHRNVRRDLKVTTVFGFERHFIQPEHWDSPEGWTIQRQAFNTKVQNGAACVTYCSMIWLQEQLEKEGLKSKLILQVHDSVVVDVYPGERDRIVELVTRSMEGARDITNLYGVDIDIPLRCDVEVGKNWGELNAISESA